MSAGAKGEVRVGLAVESGFFGGVESIFIVVGGGPAERDAAFWRDYDAMDVCFHRADAADVRER